MASMALIGCRPWLGVSFRFFPLLALVVYETCLEPIGSVYESRVERMELSASCIMQEDWGPSTLLRPMIRQILSLLSTCCLLRGAAFCRHPSEGETPIRLSNLIIAPLIVAYIVEEGDLSLTYRCGLP